MDWIRHLVYVLIVIYVIRSASVSAEIHRTKTVGLNNGVKLRRNLDRPSADSKPDMHELHDGTSDSSRYEIWTYSLLGSVLVGLSGIFPLLVIPLESGPALRHGVGASHLKLMLSFAVGGLLGDVFLHLLPEAWAYLDKDDLHNEHNKVGLWIISGLLVFLVIEKTFADEHEYDPLEDPCSEQLVCPSKTPSKPIHLQTESSHKKKRHKNKTSVETANHKNSVVHNDVKSNSQHKEISTGHNPGHIKVSGYLNLLANCIDNFTHGLAVSGSFLISYKVGLLTTFAILLHEIPHEIGDFAILLRSGFDRWKAAKAQLLTATGGIIGAVTALLSDSAQAAGERTAWILPFTSGGFLYIALVTVVPDLLQEKQGWESVKQMLCLLGGIGAMCFVTLFC